MSYERFTGEESQSSASSEISSAQTSFPLEEMANRNSQRPAHATSRSGKAMQVVLFRFFTPSFQRKSPYLFCSICMGRSLLWAYGMGKGCILRRVLRGPLYTRYKLTARGLSSSAQSILSNQFKISKEKQRIHDPHKL